MFSAITRQMVRGLLTVTMLASSICHAAPQELAARQSDACHDVHLFLARGAGDTYPGTQGPLVEPICKGFTSCGYENVLYVGTFDKVCNSVTVGVANETNQITSYAARCPKAKLVLCGHSEGSAVTLNVIGGGGTSCPGGTMPATKGLDPDSSPGRQIVAIALTGDMRHTANQPYNVGTGSAKNGIWPRSATELQGLTKWQTKMRSWCDSADPVCAGGSDVSAHGAYMNRVKDEMAAWIKGVVNNSTV